MTQLTKQQFTAAINKIKQARINPNTKELVKEQIATYATQLPDLGLTTFEEQRQEVESFILSDPATWEVRDLQKYAMWIWKHRPTS